ncbi:TIGR04282 family arsenosugar biosynthesis glycosyltransferase [Verrucomicrobiales bacterium]|nr:TIGR04282 family arsenosugar biosynthesis glycosyltransferase [Verrucomicrobiales bacterium]
MIVFAKVPEAGRVKTRLAASIGDDAAVAAYRRLAEETFRQLPRSADVWVSYAPGTSEAEDKMREWLGPIFPVGRWLPQVDGGLGDRLEDACRAGFKEGARQVTVIGTDCIGLDAEVFGQIDPEADVYYVPANDGGYVLATLQNESAIAVFHGIRWSTEHVLNDSIAAAKNAGLTVAVSPLALEDVDTESEWRKAEKALTK